MTPANILNYERLGAELWRHIMVFNEEKVVVRQAFRWFMDGEVIPNAYESMSIERVCEDRGWKVVAKYGDHIAIVNPIF